jgi:hypothetical protein
MENKNQNKLSLLILPIILIVIIISISVYLLSSLKSVKLPALPDIPDIDINEIVNDYFKQSEKNFTYNNGKAKNNNTIYTFEDLENKLNEIQEHNHINCIQVSKYDIFIADDNGNVSEFQLDLLENESDSLQNYLKQNSTYNYLYKFIGQDFVLYLDKDSIKEIVCSYIERSNNQYLGIFATPFNFSIKMSNEEYNKLKATNDFKINEEISTIG